MKIKITLILLLIIPLNLFGQKIKYSLGAGVNYNYFTYPVISNDADVIPIPSSIHDTISFYLINIDSKEKVGFNIKNNLTFSLKRNFALKTGIGLFMNNVVFNISEDKFETFIDPISGETIINKENNSHIFSSCTSYDPVQSKYYMLSFNIPVHLQKNLLNEKLIISSGISTFVLIPILNRYSPENPCNYSIPLDLLSINIDIGLEYNLFNNIYAGLFLSQHIINLYTTIPHIDPEFVYIKPKKYKLNNISFNLTYKF